MDAYIGQAAQLVDQHRIGLERIGEFHQVNLLHQPGKVDRRFDAGVAASNMKLVSFTPKPAQFDTARGLTFVNSDLAFGTHFMLAYGVVIDTSFAATKAIIDSTTRRFTHVSPSGHR